ncbi:MAG: hypothetical protein ACKOPE_07900 [Novosphingobium sp.]
MTSINQTASATFAASDYTVYRRKGEGLWNAKKRWERETGRRGWCIIR